MEDAKQLGADGEDFAAYYLKLKGYEIVARNVHSQGGEVDIIAYDKTKTLFILVEVKTRTSEAYITGLEAIGANKQKKMQSAAAHFFLNVLRWPQMPDFELHAMVLTPDEVYSSRFSVEYYDDLS